MRTVHDIVKKTSDARQMQRWLQDYDNENYQLYILGKVKFRLKPRHIPFISVKDCQENGIPLKRYGFDGAKKMENGETQVLLWTLEEWRLLRRNYVILDEEISEMWVANAETGFFLPAITVFFDGKESSKGLTRSLFKLDLNGGCHGKAMQKFLTCDIVELDGWHLHRVGKAMDLVEQVSAKTNPLVGLTCMSHARCRLVEHCDIVTEAGYRVLMTDTDSMVTDCPPDALKQLLDANGWKDWLIPAGEKRMEKTLGRFEQEGPDSPIDEFRCWGLKRYAEFTQTENGLKLRKSAFAGMHDKDQAELLQQEYSEVLDWVSSGKKWVGECYAIRKHDVHVEVESVFESEGFRDRRTSDFVGHLEDVRKWVITV